MVIILIIITIGTGSFGSFSSLSELILTNGLQIIGLRMFSIPEQYPAFDSNLAIIIIPSTVTCIGNLDLF